MREEDYEKRHSPGAWVWSINHREPVQIVQIQQLWGVAAYRIWIPSNDTVVWMQDDGIKPLAASEVPSRERLIYLATALKISETLSQEMLISPLISDVIPLPHQLYALSRAVSGERVRYLLADEVGLGKTVEAGLIMQELKLRGKVKRVLVVAPKGLVEQWTQEMLNHFGEEFKILIPESTSGLFGEGVDMWGLFDQMVVPLDSVKPLKRRKGWSRRQIAEYNRGRFDGLTSAGWDLIIVDEAHKLAGSTSMVARHKLGEGLARASPYLLLLSATPHQGKTDAFLRLMSLLDRKIFNDTGSIEQAAVRKYVIRTEKRRAIDVKGESLFKPRDTRIISVEWEDQHQKQRELYEGVTTYVRSGYNRAIKERKNYIGFLMVLMQRLVSSSTRAIESTLERRLSVIEGKEYVYSKVADLDEEWWEMDVQERMEDMFSRVIPAFNDERDDVNSLLSLARRSANERPDAKAEVLVDLMYRLRREENNPDLKFLVFTEFVPTQDMVKDFLSARGFSVVCLNGSMNFKERRETQKSFASEANVMVSTEAGGEGLNLQFCHIVINYDIPWNPMRLEQRIGRADRIGQKHPVKVFNFVFHDTIEKRVHEVLEEKLAVILHDLGFDKIGDVLDSGESERGFEDLYVDAIMEPGRAEEKLNAFIESFRTRAEDEHENLEFLEADDALKPEIASEMLSHPLPSWIERIVTNYLISEGGKVGRSLSGYDLVWHDGYSMNDVVFDKREAEGSDADLLTLNNPRLQNMFRSIPHYAPGQPVVCVKLNGLPKEIEGCWSLWMMVVRIDGRKNVHVFPHFYHTNGKVLMPTANRVWDAMMRGEFEVIDQKTESGAPYHEVEESAMMMGHDRFLELKDEANPAIPELYPVLFIHVEGFDDGLA